MPLIRFEVRNEYGLGAKELYTEANKDDPKAILEGVAVAGLVGILRQLGDLAEFAADVFHDLQEQVMATASRSRKMMARAQHIEAALPPLEKTILAQKSHIHFAYTAGSDWHPHIQTEQNHFIHSDLPRFIMDSFEECRDPPRLHLLDKFDTGGPGACLRRYSDPSFFKKELTSLESVSVEKVQREKKASKKSKKKGSRRRNGEVSHAVSMSRHSGRMPFSSPNVNGRIPTAETISTIHVRSKSELGDRSTSFDSRASSGYIECVFDASSSVLYRDQEPNDFSASRLKMQNNGSITPDEQTRGSFDTLTPRSLEEHVPYTPSVTWEEKTEIVKPKSQQSDNVAEYVGEATELLPESFDLGKLESEDPPLRNIDPEDIICVNENIQELLSEGNRYDEVGSEPDSYMDALNTLESESETDSECQTKREVELASAKFKHREIECGPDVMSEMTSQNSESPNVENRTASYSSSIRQMSENVFDMASSEDLVDAPPPQITSTPSNPDVSVDTNLCESTDLLDDSGVNVCESATNGLSYSDLCESTDLLDDSGVNVCESATNGLSYSDSTLPDSESPLSDKIVSSLSESHPVNISTNGSLCESQECSMDGPSSLGSNIPNSGAPLDDKIASSLCESQESPVEVSGPPSIAVWTNGGLLGLEPSKPPDFNVLNVANHKLVAGTNDDTHDLSNDTKLDMVEKKPSSGGGRERSPDIIGQNGLPQNQLIRRTGDMAQKIDHIECSTSYHDKQDDGMLQKQSVELLTAGSERLEKSEDLRHNSSSSNVHGQGLTEAIPDAKGPFSEASQENMESTSSLFGLSQRLLINGFRRKGSLVHDNTSELRESVKTGLFMLHEHEQKGKNKVAHQGKNKVVHQISTELNPKEQLENGSPVNSLSSSPPLEHMKISFHPINGYETAKLKLKFPGGNHFHESIKDVMFPSFQLLPEPAISLQDIDSDSDDDTFCRSSPYMSDEHMSQQSESSSEQWESGKIAGSKDHEMYDALRRVSSAESILSTFELEGIGHDSIHCNDDFKSLNTENGLEPFHYNPLTIQQERKCDSDPKDHIDSVSQCPNEPLQSLPPLPPVQWREMKSYFDIAETEQGVMSQALNQPDNLNILGATTPSQQPKPAPPKQPHMKEATSYLPKSKDQQSGENREANKTANFKEKDEREDLLHQIRTKSFNLKRTVPARPTVTPVPTTNVKVAAILEKANAIRQAFVGSDEEGNSESWSDG